MLLLSIMGSRCANILILSLLALLSFAKSSFAQKQFNNWYFGAYEGLNFNTTPPTQQKGALFTQEGSAVISDHNGNLLFYTDGRTVYNKLHAAMPNGRGLPSNESTTQPAVIVPDPTDANRYYIFTTPVNSEPNGALQYSIVDMREDAGKGDVVSKNVRVIEGIDERIAAISTCEGDTYWIIVHKLGGNDFYAFYLGRSGLETIPVISTTGLIESGFASSIGIGWLTPSPNGDMLALSHYAAKKGVGEVFKFNRKTGVVSDAIELIVDEHSYGVAFSPNNSKVYFGGKNAIIKYDVSNYDPAVVPGTRHVVPHGWSPRSAVLKLAPDHNIYVRTGEFIHRISNPNSDGFTFTKNVYFLGPGNEHSGGFPVDPVITTSECPAPVAVFEPARDSLCTGMCISFRDRSRLEPADWQWQFDGATPSESVAQNPKDICYNEPGKYQVRLIVSNGYGSDTTFREIVVSECALPAVSLRDTTICLNDCVTFTDTGGLSNSWKWEVEYGAVVTIEPRDTIRVCYSQLGRHRVSLVATNQYGSDTAECFVTVIDCTIPQAMTQHDTEVCVGESIDFTDASAGAPKSWSWTFDGGTPQASSDQHPTNIRYDQLGRYRVRLIVSNDGGGDTVESWVTVNECKPPVAKLINRTICQGDSILITDESVHYPTGWQWTFEGASITTSTSRTAGYVRYDNAGYHAVRLIVSNEFGSDTADATITVLSATPNIIPGSLEIRHELNTCTALDTSIVIYNGCKDTEYQLHFSGSSDIIVQPTYAFIPANDSVVLHLQLRPSAAGAFLASLRMTLNEAEYELPVKYTVAQSGGLEIAPLHLDFGETSICEERDSVIWLKNHHCDTLAITDAYIDRGFALGNDVPIALAPGDSVALSISTLFDTVGKPTAFSGVLTLTSNAAEQLAPIALSRSLHYPTKLRIEASDEATGVAGDEVKFRIILEGDVPTRMTALHFDFLHDNDLLSFRSLEGAGLSITSTIGESEQRQSFTLSPVRAGVLGEVTFKAYFADTEQTTLSFDNIRFDAEGVFFAPECIAVISDSGSRFDYVYTCGDNLLRNALRGEPLIKSLTPNPATNEIRLELREGIEDVGVTIVDLLGREMLHMRSAGTINVSGLISGTYHLRVESNGVVQRRTMIIHR